MREDQVRILYDPSSKLQGTLGHIVIQTAEQYISLYPNIPIAQRTAWAYLSSWPVYFMSIEQEQPEKNDYKIIDLYDFDTQKINKFIQSLKKMEPHLSWAIWGKRALNPDKFTFNCASIAFYLLKLGGLNRILEKNNAMEGAVNFFGNSQALQILLHRMDDPEFRAKMTQNPNFIKIVAALRVLKGIAGISCDPDLLEYNYKFHCLDCNLFLTPEKVFSFASFVHEKQNVPLANQSIGIASSSNQPLANINSMWYHHPVAIGVGVGVAAVATYLTISVLKK